MRQTRIAAKGEVRPPSDILETIRFWAGLSDYEHNELGNEGGYDGVQQTFLDKSLETRVEAQLRPLATPIGALTTSLGVQGFRQSLSAAGVDGGLFDPNRTKSVAGFLFNELRLTDGLRAQAAARVERVNVAGAVPDFAANPAISLQRGRDFTPLSGAAALLQDLPGGLIASLNAQYIQRAPRAPELFSRGPHDATGTFDVGNPNLATETAKTVELGLRRAAGPFRFEANVYYTRFEGFIFRNLTGQSCDASFASCTPVGGGGDLAQALYAQRNAVFRGGEFQSQIDAAPLAGGTLGVENQFDVVRASFASGGNVPRIPPVRHGGGLFWRDANWLARVNLLHAFAQNNIAATGETPTKGYDLLKAELSYRMILPKDSPFGREVTLGVAGNNLLNRDIRNSVSYRKNEVLLPGANLRFFANVLF
jgi:iron complex outermembrane recepter protein